MKKIKIMVKMMILKDYSKMEVISSIVSMSAKKRLFSLREMLRKVRIFVRLVIGLSIAIKI